MSASTGTAVALDRAGEADVRARSSAGGASSVLIGRMLDLPLEEWVSLALLTCMSITAAWSLQLANWGDSPSVLPSLFVAGVVALTLARSRMPWQVGHIVSLPLGFVMVMWQASLRAEGTSPVGRGFDTWYRFGDWLEAARSGGVSLDTLPFTVMFLSAAWLVGYAAAWPLFRWRSPWPAVILLGLSILTSLSYRLHQFEYTFFFFVLASIALFVHVTTVRRMARWRAAGTAFPPSIRWLSVRDAVLFGPLVVVVAVVMPLWEPHSTSVREVWMTVRSPVEALREPASRLLSGIKGREAGPLKPFGDALPFFGAINLPEDPVMRIWSDYPTYHVGRVYGTYTPGGWVNSATEETTVPEHSPVWPAEPPYENLEYVDQLVQPLFPTDQVSPGGLLAEADREVRVQTMQAMEFEINLGRRRLSRSLPEDVRTFGERVREAFVYAPRPPQDALAALREIPSEGLTWRASLDGDGELVAVSVLHAEEEPAAQVNVRLATPVDADDSYRISTLVSTVSDEELMAAGIDYPAWVEDRYLQLPSTLPVRVRRLAERIVLRAGAATPFEKTGAVIQYLRSFVYSQQIEGPARGQDAIDYFLFDTVDEPCPSDAPDCDETSAKGYSQYFGSAATVLLRSVGVPARMVAGYAPGEYVSPTEGFVVRGTDRHGWSQVFFPRYGWIDVEATPGVAEHVRGLPVPQLNRPLLYFGLPSGEEDQLLYEEDLEDLGEFVRQARGAVGAGADPAAVGWWVVALAGALSGTLGFPLLVWLVWRWSLRGLPTAEHTYTQMTRLGTLLGIGRPEHYTSSEYAGLLTGAAPHLAQAVGAIVAGYEARTYGRSDESHETTAALKRAWRTVGRGMVKWRLRTLVPGHRSIAAGERAAQEESRP